MISKQNIKKILAFRSERNWEKYNTPKNVAVSVAIEAAELLEHFQWTENNPPSDKAKQEIAYEIADVAIYLSYLCNDLNIDLDKAVTEKIEINKKKYPVEELEQHERRLLSKT
jgi:NTP pyrophosphatase (non-canonical NTP hydrolase)